MKILDNVERLAEVFDEKKITIIDNVVIFNHHLVHPVMLDMFEFMLKVERNHNLAAIFICADGPLGKLGEYERWSRSFLLSLPRILSYTLETEEKADGLSLAAGCWINLAHTFLHELRHNVSRALEVAVKGETDTPEYEESLEQDAHEYAGFTLEKMVAEKKLEMPPLNEIPYFNTAIMETLVEEIRNGEREWAGHHKKLIDNNLIYSKDGHIYTSIYDYFLDTTQQPEVYGKPLEVGANDVRKYPLELTDKIGPSNVFDEEVFPGEQMVDTETAEVRTTARLLALADATVAKEANVEFDREELELLDSMDGMEEGEEADYGDVICEEATGGTAQSTPAPATPAPQAAPVVQGDAHATALAMCMDVYARLADHMFAVCGSCSDGSFAKPAQLALTPMPLSGEEIDSGLFTTSYTVNLENMGAVWDDVRKCGGIRGRTFRNGSLPGYDLKINWFGKERNIRLVAQNPTKNTAPAGRARAGAKIVWLINQDDTTGNPFVGSWENGVYKPCRH